jgi:hypothetical protein
MKIRNLIALLVYLCVVPAYAGSVTEVDVTVSGEGRSYQQALNDALLEAIAQINGKVIDSTKITLRADISTTSNEDSEYYSTDAYQSLIKERTNGAVSSYQITDSFEEDGVWQVEVVAQVAKFKMSKSAQRKRVVVVPAKVQEGSFSVLSKGVPGRQASMKIDQAISDILTGTRKFAVLDRQSDEVVQKELALAASGKSPTTEAARLGKKLVTDFVLVGQLEDLHYSTQTKKMRSSDRTYTIGAGSIVYSYNLIEVATSQVFFSDTINIKVDHNDVAKSDRSNSTAITNTMLTKAASKIVGTLTRQIYPLAIIAKSGDEVILSEGGKSLKVGDRYKVYKRGKKIYDPYTKEFSGFEEHLCCTLKVTRLAPKQSYAVMLTGSDQLPEQIPDRTYVLRDKVSKKTADPIRTDVFEQEDSNW